MIIIIVGVAVALVTGLMTCGELPDCRAGDMGRGHMGGPVDIPTCIIHMNAGRPAWEGQAYRGELSLISVVIRLRPQGGACSLAYASIDDAAATIVRLGRFTELAKLDIASAYRVVPVHPDDRLLLGMRWKGEVFVDSALPFGLRSAPKVFTAVADGLEWILRTRGRISPVLPLSWDTTPFSVSPKISAAPAAGASPPSNTARPSLSTASRSGSVPKAAPVGPHGRDLQQTPHHLPPASVTPRHSLHYPAASGMLTPPLASLLFTRAAGLNTLVPCDPGSPATITSTDTVRLARVAGVSGPAGTSAPPRPAARPPPGHVAPCTANQQFTPRPRP